ncbi:hypothetical protein [Ructibacterium gallinarum]|uniref:Uncharacterized protein n=1 Tax=Ructibacterium gallinarum TaxID=2779355 RepID=A0A9D5M0R7_9FIRM|nr:hypothetical protein [Ructibacterium gallinarum]MBE5039338.1 hypothetical protein [Ructibacterium gallinarum]
MKHIVLKANDLIPTAVLLLCFSFACFPPLTTYVPSIAVTFPCLCIWFFYSFLEDRNFFLNGSWKVTGAILFVLYSILIPYMLGAGIFGNRYADLTLIPMAPLIYHYYKVHNRLYVLNNVLIVVVVLLIITTFITQMALIEQPYISRNIKSGEESYDTLRQGIGGYSLIYTLVPCSIILTYVFLRERKWLKKILVAAGLCIIVPTIILSNYMTALIATFLGCVLTVVLEKTVDNKNKAFAVLMGLVFVSIFLFWGKDILNYIIDFILQIAPSGRTAERLLEFQGSILEGIQEEMQSDRLPTLLSSVETFFAHPLMGIIAADEQEWFSFGQHSHVIDTFAIFGILGGIFNLTILVLPYREKGKWIRYGRSLTIPIFLSMCIIYGQNNATDSIALVYGVFYPYIRDYYQKKNQRVLA